MGKLVECPDCLKDFAPTPDNEVYCTRCNAIFELDAEREFEEGTEYEQDEV